MSFFRETLLGQLTVYIQTLHSDFQQRSGAHHIAGGEASAPPKGKNLPEVVNNIVWARQMESKVRYQKNVGKWTVYHFPHA